MIYTVRINENTPNGKRIVEELRSNYKDVEFVDSTLVHDKNYIAI